MPKFKALFFSSWERSRLLSGLIDWVTNAYAEKKFSGIISYGVYLQPTLGSSGGPWKFPWNIALQLGTGGPVERSFGLPTWTGGPCETPGGGP